MAQKETGQQASLEGVLYVTVLLQNLLACIMAAGSSA